MKNGMISISVGRSPGSEMDSEEDPIISAADKIMQMADKLAVDYRSKMGKQTMSEEMPEVEEEESDEDFLKRIRA